DVALDGYGEPEGEHDQDRVHEDPARREEAYDRIKDVHLRILLEQTVLNGLPYSETCLLTLIAGAKLVVVHLAHEHFSVDRSSTLVDRVRDAEPVAELRALPRDDDQRLRRLLVAEDGHARQ